MRLLLLQYSAASFIETVNANSLTIDPDEFMARMVAAGIPDMALAPNPAAPLLRGKSSAGAASADAMAPILATPAADALPQEVLAAATAAAPLQAALEHPSAAPAVALTPIGVSTGLPPTHEGLSDSPAPTPALLPTMEVHLALPGNPATHHLYPAHP